MSMSFRNLDFHGVSGGSRKSFRNFDLFRIAADLWFWVPAGGGARGGPGNRRRLCRRRLFGSTLDPGDQNFLCSRRHCLGLGRQLHGRESLTLGTCIFKKDQKPPQHQAVLSANKKNNWIWPPEWRAPNEITHALSK